MFSPSAAEFIESFLIFLVGALIVIAVVMIVIYVVTGIFLNKFNKLVYGKGTPLAWIPLCRAYLLGKLAFNQWVGWAFVVATILVSVSSDSITGVNGETFSLLPSELRNALGTVLSYVILGTFIYAVIKYFKLKKQLSSKDQSEQLDQGGNSQ